MSKLSIITINYNDLAGLRRTVDSVSHQTWQEFEHIIIDGGSTDGSVAFIKEYQNDFAYWVSEPDQGVYSAMNKGLAQSSGEYVLFLNAGDHFQNQAALNQAYTFLTGEAIVYFDLEVVDQERIFVKSYPDTLSFSYFVEDSLPHPASFIKKDAFAKAGVYKEDFKILSDWKFFIDAICKHGMSYKRVPQVLSTFYLGGMSSDPKNYDLKNKERYQVLEQDYAVYLKDIQDVIKYKRIIATFKKSRIISILTKFGFLNKFNE
jgi:glycosyltransferase involved in cell wall biosynthesis